MTNIEFKEIQQFIGMIGYGYKCYCSECFDTTKVITTTLEQKGYDIDTEDAIQIYEIVKEAYDSEYYSDDIRDIESRVIEVLDKVIRDRSSDDIYWQNLDVNLKEDELFEYFIDKYV